MQHDREADFRAGLALLMPFFEDLDFELKVYPPHVEAQGTCYSAQFVWGNHAVTLIHLAGLGPVTYSIGAMSIEHTAYLDALGVREGAAFPPAASGSGAGYEGLLSDLESRMRPFFEEPDREFMEIAEAHGQQGRPWLPSQ